jgi:cellulose synthase/poly-beta-1,6-N-acetylglucosamine synthase-like glycosyltransferase
MWFVLFYTAGSIILYSYVGYPLLLAVISVFKSRSKQTATQLPLVTVIIAAYNEEAVIGKKIENTLAADYPLEKLQLIVAAQGSTDRTAAIAAAFPNVLVMQSAERKGKAVAVNEAVAQAIHPVVVLTDANTLLTPQTIQRLVLKLNDAATGAVAGEKKVVDANNATVSGEGLYWRYESWLKQQETVFYTVVGAAGELFAFKKELFVPIPAHAVTDDFFLSLSVNMQGKKVAYAADAISTEAASHSLKDEWNRKLRIAAGGIQSLLLVKKALNPFRYPVLSFQFFSHRVLRWLFCGPAFLVLLLANVMLANTTSFACYGVVLLLQILFYVFALIGYFISVQKKSFFLFTVPFYIVFMHAAMMAGFVRYFTNGQSVLWEKAQR